MEIMESLSTLQIVYQIASLSPWLVERKTWTLQRSRLLEFYTLVVIAFATAVLLYGIFADDSLVRANNNEIGETVDSIQLVGIRIAHIVSIAEALLRRKEQQSFYEQLNEIDRIFERSLNVNFNYGKFRSHSLKHCLLMLSVYIITEGYILATHLIWDKEEHFLSYWMFYMMPLLICGLRYFQMFTAIYIMKRRLDQLINVLNDINMEKPEKVEVLYTSLEPLKTITPSSFSPLEFSMHTNTHKRYNLENVELKKLLIIRDLYSRLFSLTEMFNRYFGISMLVNIGNEFISITCNCYWIFINSKYYGSSTLDFLQIAASAVWSVPHLLNVLILTILCEKTMQSTTSIALGLHRIHIDTFNDNHNAVIQQFSLQLLHQKITITAAGFFSIDCTLLYTIVGATTTYLIILIQFNLNEQTNV